jgi:hypothetical protein
VTTGRGSRWEARFWAIQANGSVQYDCALSRHDRVLAVDIAATDSIPCIGLMASCGSTLEGLEYRFPRK